MRVLALLLLVTVAALLAWLRWWVRLRVRWTDLSALADSHLGSRPGPDLGRAGPAGERIARACGDQSLAGPLIATACWQSIVASTWFDAALRRLGASSRVRVDGEFVVVRHGEGTRYDLVVLDPGFGPGRPAAAALEVGPLDAQDKGRTTWRRLVRDRRNAPWSAIDEATVEEAIRDATRAAMFGVVLVAPPPMIALSCPSPAWSVATSPSDPGTATVGAVVHAPSGKPAVTTAYHAVKGQRVVWVGAERGEVVSEHPATDSCLIEVASTMTHPGLGRNGPLRGLLPAGNARAVFDGCASGRKETVVIGWDLDLPDDDPLLALKLFTLPDTIPGDSGAALVDATTDHILGFAAKTSGFDAPIRHSTWVWADQVFAAHGLHDVRTKEGLT